MKNVYSRFKTKLFNLDINKAQFLKCNFIAELVFLKGVFVVYCGDYFEKGKRQQFEKVI